MASILTPTIIELLQSKFPNQISTNVALSECSRWRIGGIAQCIFTPDTEHSLMECVRLCKQKKLHYVVLGATSNLLFSDHGLFVLGISLSRLRRVKIEKTRICAQAGVWVPSFARQLASKGLTGLEHIVGIPGTLGGLVFMNGGSLRKGVGSHVERVKTVAKNGHIITYTNNECDFGYRQSCFQGKEEIIMEIELKLQIANVTRVRTEMLGLLRSRRQKFPLKDPNCGSVFVSNPAMYADYGSPGLVIERCQLKGLKQGGAQVSTAHANFIVNNGGASSWDVLNLIRHIQRVVQDKTGYKMVSEVRFLSEYGKIYPACDVMCSE